MEVLDIQALTKDGYVISTGKDDVGHDWQINAVPVPASNEAKPLMPRLTNVAMVKVHSDSITVIYDDRTYDTYDLGKIFLLTGGYGDIVIGDESDQENPDDHLWVIVYRHNFTGIIEYRFESSTCALTGGPLLKRRDDSLTIFCGLDHGHEEVIKLKSNGEKDVNFYELASGYKDHYFGLLSADGSGFTH